MFGVLAVVGGGLLTGHETVYYSLLPLTGVLAALQAFGYYLTYGITLLTLLFALAGVVGIARGVQAYRALW